MDMTSVNASGRLIHISISDFLVLSFYSTTTNIVSRCMVLQKTNPAAELISLVASHNSYFTTNPPPIRALLSTTTTFANSSSQWFYLRCGINNETKKYFIYGQKQATTYPGVVVESNVPQDTLFRSEGINVTDGIRNIYRNFDTLTLNIYNASLLNSPVYLKNLYILQEYIRESVQFQY